MAFGPSLKGAHGGSYGLRRDLVPLEMNCSFVLPSVNALLQIGLERITPDGANRQAADSYKSTQFIIEGSFIFVGIAN
jgi:hypothetical protein